MTRARKRRIGAVVLAFVASPLSVLAQNETLGAERPFDVALEYVAPASCPSAAELAVLVSRQLGYDAFRNDAPQQVVIIVTLDGRAFGGHVEWRDTGGKWAGEQSFPGRSDDCAEVVRAIGVALAVQIHLLAAEVRDGAIAARPASNVKAPGPGEVPAKGGMERDTSVSRASVADATRDGSPRRGRGLSWSLGAGTSLGLGLASGAVLLGRVFVSAAGELVSLELAFEPSTSVTTRRADGAGFDERVLLAGAAACGNRDTWSLCLITKAGVVHVEGRDIDAPSSSSGAVVQAGLRLGARLPLGARAYLGARAEALVNCTRPSVLLDRAPVWTAPVMAWTGGIDVGVRLP